MKKNYTHVAILLDRSGSMSSIANDIIGGFNQLIKDQKKEPGKLTVTLASFASRKDYTVIYDTVDVDSVKELTSENYRTTGGTALNDSFVRLINETGAKLAILPESERPGKVLLVSLTDGEENDSQEETTLSVKRAIEHQEQKYNWKFLYIGANQDSFAEGVQLRGYTKAMNFTADSLGTEVMYKSVGTTLARFRNTGDLNINSTTTNADSLILPNASNTFLDTNLNQEDNLNKDLNKKDDLNTIKLTK